MSLETVRTGPRFECPAAQAGCTQCLELARERDDLLLILDRTGAGDHGHPNTANLQPSAFTTVRSRFSSEDARL